MREFLAGLIVGASLMAATAATATLLRHYPSVTIYSGQTPILYTGDHPNVDFRWTCEYKITRPKDWKRLGFKPRTGERAWAWCSLYPNGVSNVTWDGADFSVLLTSRRALIVSNGRHPRGNGKILWQRVATRPGQ